MQHDTLVTRWSHHDYDTPIPLVTRYSLGVGDVVDSSHYGKVKILAMHRTEENAFSHSIHFEFSRPDGSLLGTDGNGRPMRMTEIYPGNSMVPLFEKASPEGTSA